MTNEEINEAVAVKVMGWKLKKVTPNGNRIFEDRKTEDIYTVGKSAFSQCWSPSTRIDDAFHVVEMLMKRGWRVEIIGEPNHQWDCVIYGIMAAKPIARKAGETAPLCICRAALAALEAGGGE